MTDRRAISLALFVPTFCWLTCWPFVDMPVNDDFGYAFVVRQLLETHRLVYNGWCSPILGVQAGWGAAFVSTFGLSHNVLRASVLPLAIGCAALTYGLHRRLRVPPSWALFATLLLVGSPLFTPWSASFMTDVPGLLFTLATMHGTISLARADTSRRRTRASIGLALLGLTGGTIRQTNLAFAAVPMAIELWRRRRERPLDIAAALVALLVGGTLMLAWYARQPFATVEPWPTAAQVPTAIVSMAGLTLSLVFYLLPLGLAWLRLDATTRVADRVAIIVVATALCGEVAWQLPDAYITNFALGLWSGSTVTPTGLLFDSIDAPGARPTVFATPMRVAIAGTTYAMIASAVLVGVRRSGQIGPAVSRLCRRSGDARAVASLCVIGLVYAALLVPRAGGRLVFDRYLLVFFPIASTLLLTALRPRLAGRRPGLAAWTLVAVFGIVGIAITRDHFNELRLREKIAAAFAGEGVPRTAIANGVSFDGWTQLEATGHVNDYRIARPAGAYRPDPNAVERGRLFWFLPSTPAVEPRWIIANLAGLPPAPLPTGWRAYVYPASLPPFDRWIVAVPVGGLAVGPSARKTSDSAAAAVPIRRQ